MQIICLLKGLVALQAKFSVRSSFLRDELEVFCGGVCTTSIQLYNAMNSLILFFLQIWLI